MFRKHLEEVNIWLLVHGSGFGEKFIMTGWLLATVRYSVLGTYKERYENVYKYGVGRKQRLGPSELLLVSPQR